MATPEQENQSTTMTDLMTGIQQKMLSAQEAILCLVEII